LKAAEVVDRMPSAEHLANRHALEKAYSRWLAARAARDDPDGPEDAESANRRDEEYAQAEHELALMPAILDWMVWCKLEMLTLCIEDARTGRRGDSAAVLFQSKIIFA
jgi:hypothetical protein